MITESLIGNDGTRESKIRLDPRTIAPRRGETNVNAALVAVSSCKIYSDKKMSFTLLVRSVLFVLPVSRSLSLSDLRSRSERDEENETGSREHIVDQALCPSSGTVSRKIARIANFGGRMKYQERKPARHTSATRVCLGINRLPLFRTSRCNLVEIIVLRTCVFRDRPLRSAGVDSGMKTYFQVGAIDQTA